MNTTTILVHHDDDDDNSATYIGFGIGVFVVILVVGYIIYIRRDRHIYKKSRKQNVTHIQYKKKNLFPYKHNNRRTSGGVVKVDQIF